MDRKLWPSGRNYVTTPYRKTLEGVLRTDQNIFGMPTGGKTGRTSTVKGKSSLENADIKRDLVLEETWLGAATK